MASTRRLTRTASSMVACLPSSPFANSSHPRMSGASGPNSLFPAQSLSTPSSAYPSTSTLSPLTNSSGSEILINAPVTTPSFPLSSIVPSSPSIDQRKAVRPGVPAFCPARQRMLASVPVERRPVMAMWSSPGVVIVSPVGFPSSSTREEVG
ncbi:hypothetical protein CC2G_003537 [Coprinopsis cinerea AmutBmut pab1-1]|nr:hypothetical protein CC2G_003537 [Coprinopsis cinerea AmutBmut pab1-1]